MDTKSVSLKGLNVMIAIPGGRNPPWDTVGSLIQTAAYLTSIKVPFLPAVVQGNALVTRARDELVDIFLKSTCNRLFWIDDDIVWKVDDFMRLLALSTLVDIVAASYPSRSEPTRYFLNMHGEVGDEARFSEYGLIEIDGLGMGFTCMKREPVQAVYDMAPRMWDSVCDKEMRTLFRLDTDGKGNYRSEDMAFFADLRECGYRAWLDPTIDLGHVGQKTYRGCLLDVLEHKKQETPVTLSAAG